MSPHHPCGFHLHSPRSHRRAWLSSLISLGESTTRHSAESAPNRLSVSNLCCKMLHRVDWVQGERKPNISYGKADVVNGCCDGLSVRATFLGVWCSVQPITCIGSGMGPWLEVALVHLMLCANLFEQLAHGNTTNIWSRHIPSSGSWWRQACHR
jgi:hypothetical protein